MARFRGEAAVLIALVALPVAGSWLHEPFLVSLATRVMIFAIAAIGIDVLVGLGGLASLGHGIFFGLGAYLTVVLNTLETGPSWWRAAGKEALLAWPFALLLVAVVATLLGFLCLRARGFPFIMITLAFAQMTFLVVTSSPALGGDEGLRMAQRQQLAGVSLAQDTYFYAVCLVLMAATLVLARMVGESRFGAVLEGCRQNERRMRFLGYRSRWYLLCAFVLSAIAAGLAGTLLANENRFASPSALSWIQSGDFLIMVVIGGLGTLRGGLIGAAAFIVLEQALSGWFQEWQFFLGIPLLLIVLFAKHGIAGLLRRRATHD